MEHHRKNQLHYKRAARVLGRPTNVGDPLGGSKPKKEKKDV